MKKIETPEQLLQRFSKRTMELQRKLSELEGAHLEYLKLEKDLERLRGSEQAVRYIVSGKLPNDGNHDGMRDHKPHTDA